MAFDPKAHLTDIKGKQYLEVKWRLVWFREDKPADSGWGIWTQEVEVTEDKARFRAEVRDPDGRVIAAGTKTETPQGFADFVEKAETGAIGRALAVAGFGTQFCDDLDEGERLADSPVGNGGSPAPQQSSGGQPQAAPSGGEFGPCPKCGAELRTRKGGSGDFVGCSSYNGKDNPGCGFTSNVEDAPRAGAAPAAAPSPEDEPDPFGDDTFDEEGYPISVAGVSEFLSALGVPEGDARPDLIDNAMKALWGARVKPETLTADHCVALGRKLEELMPSGG